MKRWKSFAGRKCNVSEQEVWICLDEDVPYVMGNWIARMFVKNVDWIIQNQRSIIRSIKAAAMICL